MHALSVTRPFSKRIECIAWRKLEVTPTPWMLVLSGLRRVLTAWRNWVNQNKKYLCRKKGGDNIQSQGEERETGDGKRVPVNGPRHPNSCWLQEQRSISWRTRNVPRLAKVAVRVHFFSRSWKLDLHFGETTVSCACEMCVMCLIRRWARCRSNRPVAQQCLQDVTVCPFSLRSLFSQP